jgi:arginyl-tRNA synthetase
MDFQKQISRLLDEAGVKDAQLEVPPNPSLGHFAFPTFPLAKERRKAPVQIAQELVAEIQKNPQSSFLEKVVATGPYVNFFIKGSALVQASFNDPEFQENGKTVVIDYSAPNIAKPFGIGHLRSTVIGGALKRVYSYAGWKTVGINHLGDWGTQFGKLIAAYKRWPTDISQDPIKRLLELYVKFHAEAEQDPTLEDAGREEFRKLEAGDPENTRLWQQFRDLSLKEFNRLYEKLGVSFESNAGEAFYNDKMQAVVDELQAKGLLEEDEGAQIVRLDDEGIQTPAIILKKDGATIYTTRDLAALIYRKKTYSFDRILYEVGSEQNLHFKQLFAIIKKMGYPWHDECYHVNHGLYMFETGKMSTRKGQVIFIEDVLQKSIDLSLKTIQEKNPALADKQEVAEQVGIGAIVFFDMKNDRTKDIIFDWDEILSFEGETGPYLQYTHARLRSILRKSSEKPEIMPELLNTEDDLAVASHLLKLQETIEQVIQNNKPHILARYLLDLAQLINSYYQKHRIIQEDKELERARLALIQKGADRIKLGLSLLGIKAPNEM